MTMVHAETVNSTRHTVWRPPRSTVTMGTETIRWSSSRPSCRVAAVGARSVRRHDGDRQAGSGERVEDEMEAAVHALAWP